MPSTFVHVGLAALLGTALLGRRFEPKAILVVMAVAAIPDLDTFLGLWLLDGGHRTVLHNLVVPAVLLGAVVVDGARGEDSIIRDRWGEAGYRVAWVSLLAGWIVSQVLYDAFYNGANLFWPFYDQYIDLSGELVVSDRRGLVMTFLDVEVADGSIVLGSDHALGASTDVHYFTGIDPPRGSTTGGTTERVFPIAGSGERFLLAVSGYLVVLYRVVADR